MPLTQEKTVLSLRGITKQFPGVLANDDINFDLLEGEVHTILGENGAGKSTLMSIIDGIYQPDEGTISLYGIPAFHVDSQSFSRRKYYFGIERFGQAEY